MATRTPFAYGAVYLPYRGKKEHIRRLFVCEIGYCWDTREVFIGTSVGNVLVDIPQLLEDLEPLSESETAKANRKQPKVTKDKKRRKSSRR